MPQQPYVPGQGDSAGGSPPPPGTGNRQERGGADGERVLHLGLRVPGSMGRHRRPGPPDRPPRSGWPGRHRKMAQPAAMGSGSSGH
jgi:hypothetical protein